MRLVKEYLLNQARWHDFAVLKWAEGVSIRIIESLFPDYHGILARSAKRRCTSMIFCR
jgi:hypothetical protein